MFEAKMICDSVAPNGRRLTTMTLTYPRFIHSEFMTHRDRARNAASSRAIPWSVMREAILNGPVVPIAFGLEQRGMQTGDALVGERADEANAIWLAARDHALAHAEELAALGVHKSIVNRLTEPFMWITVLTTSTCWNNLFRLRCHQDAEIHFQKIAGMARTLLENSVPVPRSEHLPYISSDDLSALGLGDARKVSVARCARVSYLTHGDTAPNVDKDMALFDRLVNGSGFGHWSPHEHVAWAAQNASFRSGPYLGWVQYRKAFAGECAVE